MLWLQNRNCTRTNKCVKCFGRYLLKTNLALYKGFKSVLIYLSSCDYSDDSIGMF